MRMKGCNNILIAIFSSLSKRYCGWLECNLHSNVWLVLEELTTAKQSFPIYIPYQVISLEVLMTACYRFYKTVKWEPLTWSSLYFIQEYSAENIDWTRVDFEDNQECLDLIEKVKYYTGAWKFWAGSICLTLTCLLDTSPHLNVNTVNARPLTNYSSSDP